MSNIDKRAYRADGGDIGISRLREIGDNPYGDEEKCWLAKRVLALLDELEAAHELVELQRFKLERQAEDLHQAKSLESIHREKRFEVEREFSDYKHRAESNSMRLAKEVCRLEDALQSAGIRINGED